MATVWKSCAFGQLYVIFVMSICNFGCFPFWFGWQDLGSDCASSGALLTFIFFQVKVFKHTHSSMYTQKFVDLEIG